MNKLINKVSDNETINMLINTIESLKKDFKKSISKIYNNSDALEYLDISPSTLASYRNKGIIGFSQHGRKIYYTQTDLDSYIEKYRKHTF